MCINLTESDKVDMSDHWRRCRGVLKENEGEEWGLSKAWGGGRGEGGNEGRRDGLSAHAQAHTNKLIKKRNCGAYLHVSFTGVH